MYRLIDTPADFAALADDLRSQPRLALDTEFMRERTYYPLLCLIQIATPAGACLIDPLKLEDLGGLQALLAQESTQTVLHAARQDIEVLLTRGNELPANVFDTQVAAALCGFSPQVGYAELVQQMLDVRLDKAHTRANWTERPLPPERLQYAAEDVIYLLPLHEQLIGRLEKLGRLSWFEEDMRRLHDPELYRADPDAAASRLKGLSHYDERRQAVGRALARWRERRAMDRNRPRNWILADAALHEIIRRLPGEVEALRELKLVPMGVVQRCGEEIVRLVRETEHLPVDDRPRVRYVRPDAQQQKKLRAMSEVVKSVASELRLSPEVLATRRDFEALLAGRTDIAPLKGWRREAVGLRLLDLL